MYSIFLPFAAVVVDLCVAYIYFKHNWWLGGGTTALIALIPLFIIAFLLYSGWSRLKQATVFLGFLHSGTQLLFQVTLLLKHWNEFGDLIIEFGTMKSPQYSIVMVSCIFSSLVVAKSARECHFLCQAPQKNHVAASHFRATPFFLLHTSFRWISSNFVIFQPPVSKVNITWTDSSVLPSLPLVLVRHHDPLPCRQLCRRLQDVRPLPPQLLPHLLPLRPHPLHLPVRRPLHLP